MVSAYHNGVERIEWVGLSTDEKPSSVPDGSTFHAVDTDKDYVMYDGTWHEYAPVPKAVLR